MLRFAFLLAAVVWFGGIRGLGLVATTSRGLATAADTKSRGDGYNDGRGAVVLHC